MTEKGYEHGQRILDTLKTVTEQQVERLGTVFDQWADLEGKGLQRATAAVDEFARMMKDALSYGAKLSDGYRKNVLESVRKATDFGPKDPTKPPTES